MAGLGVLHIDYAIGVAVPQQDVVTVRPCLIEPLLGNDGASRSSPWMMK